MQASPASNLNYKQLEDLDERLCGMVKNAIPYDKELMDAAVNDPDIEEVKVFKLRHGSRIKIGDEIFRVFRVGKNVTLKLLK